MKSTFATIAAVLSLGTSAVAQNYNQSKPFYLVAEGSQYDGTKFGACHEGAAIEGLCVGGKSLFQHNTTESQQVPNKTLGASGPLTYVLQGSNFNESEGMVFFVDPTTNVALPLFEPGYGAQQVAFDSQNRMNIQDYLDDTVTPPTDVANKAYYRWHVCQTNFEGYTYETLAWVLGNGAPQNPSCEKIDVVRQWA